MCNWSGEPLDLEDPHAMIFRDRYYFHYNNWQKEYHYTICKDCYRQELLRGLDGHGSIC